MKKYLPIFFIVIFLIGLAFLILKSPLITKASAGLQVNAIPQAKVFLDGKEMGNTPYENTKLSEGEKILKLVVENNAEPIIWEAKIKLSGGAMTLVNRELNEEDSLSSGEVITLEPIPGKGASLAIVTQPDSCLIKVDGETKGFSPIVVEQIKPGDHEVAVSSPDYKDRIIRANFFDGFRSLINVKLELVADDLVQTPSTISATPEAKVSLIATATPTMAKAKVTATPPSLARPYVKILNTPTSWLRVRMAPSTSATESAKVNPGEEYPLLDKKTGWYQISYGDNKEGWVSSQYAQLFE